MAGKIRATVLWQVAMFAGWTGALIFNPTGNVTGLGFIRRGVSLGFRVLFRGRPVQVVNCSPGCTRPTAPAWPKRSRLRLREPERTTSGGLVVSVGEPGVREWLTSNFAMLIFWKDYQTWPQLPSGALFAFFVLEGFPFKVPFFPMTTGHLSGFWLDV